ncbi:MAG TPA: response regulator [Candidatus Dojkabacteria bacterium]|jgi:DNA-binding response OmpR family regulator
MKKILIIEDEASYVKILSDRLSSLDFKISIAENGKEGLATALKDKPDLILLDIRMPIMDGTTVLTKLRKENRYGAKVKVIFLTNLEPSSEIIKQVIKNQPTYYFVKSDINLKELISKVKKLLDSNNTQRI